MMEDFKMLKGIDRVNIVNMFKFDTKMGQRGHKLILKGNRIKTDIGIYWFTNRIVVMQQTSSIIERNCLNRCFNVGRTPHQ